MGVLLATALALLLAGCGSAEASGSPASAIAPSASATAARSTSSASARFRRVTSMVTSFSNGKLVLANGQTYEVTSKTHFSRVVAVSTSSLKTGDYIAITGNRQPDNSVLAASINIFPPQPNGIAPGQRPLPGGALMTNTTIASISGNQFDVSWKGGGAKIVLAANAKVTEMQTATASAVQAGTPVAVAYNGSQATSVTTTGQ